MFTFLTAEMMSQIEELEMMANVFQLFSNFISLAMSVFLCIVMWKVFVKAGEPGWAYLIPFYGNYVECKIIKKKWLFWAEMLTVIVMSISLVVGMVGFAVGLAASIEGMGSGDTAFAIALGALIVFGLTCLAILALNIVHSINFAKAFGQGVGFTIGLILLPTIFKAIIAFSPNIYYVYGMPTSTYQNDYNYEDPNIGTGTLDSDNESRLNQDSGNFNSDF